MTCTPGKLSSDVCWFRTHWRRGRCTQCFLVITMRSVDDDNNDDDDYGNVDDGMNDESTLDCSFEECLASLTWGHAVVEPELKYSNLNFNIDLDQNIKIFRFQTRRQHRRRPDSFSWAAPPRPWSAASIINVDFYHYCGSYQDNAYHGVILMRIIII